MVWIGKGSPSFEGHSWSTWPTEGAPTPYNTGDSGIWTGPGRRWPADLSPGCSRVARAAEVSAENGHSLGRRGEGGRLGHPKGRKSWQGKHRQTFHRDRDTRKHTAYVHCPYKQQMQYILHGHRVQLENFFFKSQDAGPQHECHPLHTDTHDKVISPSKAITTATHRQTHTHVNTSLHRDIQAMYSTQKADNKDTHGEHTRTHSGPTTHTETPGMGIAHHTLPPAPPEAC